MKPIEWKDAANTTWTWKPTHVNVVVRSIEGIVFDSDLPDETETFIRFQLDSVKNQYLRTNPKKLKTWPSGSYREDIWTIAELEIPQNLSEKKEQNIIVSLITKRKNEGKKWYKCLDKNFIEKGKYSRTFAFRLLSFPSYPTDFRTVDLLDVV